MPAGLSRRVDFTPILVLVPGSINETQIRDLWPMLGEILTPTGVYNLCFPQNEERVTSVFVYTELMGFKNMLC
jgi:hypothetical protein